MNVLYHSMPELGSRQAERAGSELCTSGEVRTQVATGATVEGRGRWAFYHLEGIDWNSADEGAASTAARTQHRQNHEGEMEVVRQMLPRCYPAIAQLAAASLVGAS